MASDLGTHHISDVNIRCKICSLCGCTLHVPSFPISKARFDALLRLLVRLWGLVPLVSTELSGTNCPKRTSSNFELMSKTPLCCQHLDSSCPTAYSAWTRFSLQCFCFREILNPQRSYGFTNPGSGYTSGNRLPYCRGLVSQGYAGVIELQGDLGEGRTPIVTAPGYVRWSKYIRRKRLGTEFVTHLLRNTR